MVGYAVVALDKSVANQVLKTYFLIRKFSKNSVSIRSGLLHNLAKGNSRWMSASNDRKLQARMLLCSANGGKQSASVVS